MTTGGRETLPFSSCGSRRNSDSKKLNVPRFCTRLQHGSSQFYHHLSYSHQKNLSFTFENVVGFDCYSSPNSTIRQSGHSRFVARLSAIRPPATEGTPPSRKKTRDTFPVPASFNPYPTSFPYGNGMVLHFYQQQESSTTKTVHKVINKGLKTYV